MVKSESAGGIVSGTDTDSRQKRGRSSDKVRSSSHISNNLEER